MIPCLIGKNNNFKRNDEESTRLRHFTENIPNISVSPQAAERNRPAAERNEVKDVEHGLRAAHRAICKTVW